MPLGFLLLTAICGWEGFAVYLGKLPVVVLIIIIGKLCPLKTVCNDLCLLRFRNIFYAAAGP